MLLIKNGFVADAGSTDPVKSDIFIKDGKITPLKDVPSDLSGISVIDAEGMMVAPGLVDMHVHFRDPGFLHKEDIFTGARAAAAGGVTTAVCMPNTSPVLDSPEMIADLTERVKAADISVMPYGAVTAGQRGEYLTDAAALKAAGAVGLSDDGLPVMSAAVLLAALHKSKEAGLVIISHCEDAVLVRDYAVNDGIVSRKLGIPGRPAIAEDLMVARDAMLAKETGAPIHIAHVSTAGAVDIIRKAKAAGIPITAETCPHYFTLTEDEILLQGAMARVNPPLRTPYDVNAVIDGLMDGTIDAIATDHAPHSAAEKAQPLVKAPSGISGLETSLAVTLTELYHTGKLPLGRIIELMSTRPADILGLNKGRIGIGDDADLVIFDPSKEWTVDPAAFRSKGHNTPFAGRTLKGKVQHTIRAGKIVYSEEHKHVI